MIQYRTLEDFDIKVMHDVFTHSFSDYLVPMNVDLEGFKAMLQQRSYQAHVSWGAFKDDELVGLIINGIDSIDAYVITLGVVPEAREHGIAKQLIEHAKNKLTLLGVHTYYLEVLKDNSKAEKLYEKQGFKRLRTLNSYRLSKIEKRHCSYGLVETDWKDFEYFQGWEKRPSWQNSVKSIKNSTSLFRLIRAYDKEKIVGYCVFDPHTGQILQISVLPAYRNKNIASALLSKASKQLELDLLIFVNIDAELSSLMKFIKKNQGVEFIVQYEMGIELNPLDIKWIPYQRGLDIQMAYVHDLARKEELKQGNLLKAFVPFTTAAEDENLYDYEIVVGLVKEKVLAFGAWTENEIAWLYVDPNYKAQGIGTQLMDYMIAHMSSNIVSLEALATNKSAIQFYKKLGFKIVDTDSGPMPGNERFIIEVHEMQRNID